MNCMEHGTNQHVPMTILNTFRLGTLLRFAETIYQSPPGTVGLVYESFQEDGLTYCGVLLETGVDIGLVTSWDLEYLAEKLLQIPTTYQFTTPDELMQHFKLGAFRKAFSLVYPQPLSVPV